MFFNIQPMQKIPFCQPVGATTRANPANTRHRGSLSLSAAHSRNLAQDASA